MDFNSGPKVPFPWGSGYWPVPFSSDEALQIAGLFHQGQFPYCSGYEARQVQHFKDFNLESIFITNNIFIMKNPTDFGKTVENGVDACLPAQFLGPTVLLVNLQQLAIVRLNVGTSHCENRTIAR